MSHFTHEEIERLTQLVNECRELGDDASVWSTHFATGLMALVDADVIGTGQIGGISGGRFENLGAIDTGWERGYDRQGWINALTLFAENPKYHGGLARGYEAVANERATLLCRRQYVGDREWYRSHAFEATTGLMGFDDELTGFFPIGTGPGDGQCLIIYRDKKKPRFDQHERSMIRLAMDLVRPLVGGNLAGFREIRPTNLPPRVRQVLACLLEGDSDKEIAMRLNLSPYTVRQYCKQLFRFFGVEGRTQLMARWLRRGWSAKCVWSMGPPPTVEVIGPE